MKTYIIKYINNEITISEKINNQLSILRNKGEDSQPYEAEKFWNWWKTKVDYNNEKVEFIIESDNPNFKIDESIDYTEGKPFNLNNFINESKQASKITQEFTQKHSKVISSKVLTSLMHTFLTLSLFTKNIFLKFFSFFKNLGETLFSLFKKRRESYQKEQREVKIKSERRL